MATFRTTACTAHGHPEFTLVREGAFAPSLPLHEWLVQYFERSVAAGTKFTAGQTVQFGWSTLRLRARPDGTLGVEERLPTPDAQWKESVDDALKDLYLQREVCRSFGLDLDACPRQMQDAMVRACTFEARDLIAARLEADDLPETFSGWSFTCAEDHDHGEPSFIPLLGVAAQRPVLTQFLALPPGTSVLVTYAPVEGQQLRVSPHVFANGAELDPAPGSYVASLRG